MQPESATRYVAHMNWHGQAESSAVHKTSLFKQAIELGAQSISDLTDKVTHVIAERPGSDKYNVCGQHVWNGCG